ncbi:MAG: glycosyltransferase family 4 protein [Acidiphilium sp.]|nr:glycosyltransferase family 4 protein [Acidiphilium sp.]MDD4934379.1 glycosyltransferase family 4 protein [Acidiphilium sp.]
MTRIMHLVNHCGKANGHVNVSVDMACTQARSGHVVGYTCSKGDYIPLLVETGVKVYEVPEPHRSVGQFFAANYHLWKAIRAFRPDILHVHMAAQSVLVQPYRLFGYKTVTTVHNEFDRSVWLMGLSTRVVTVSEAGYRAMVKRGFSRKRVRFVLNGSVGSPRLAQKFTSAKLEHPAVITVCGLHPRKGIGDLLHAFRMVKSDFPAAHLYILGEGPSESEYRELATSIGLSGSAHFLGYQNDPREYLSSADIFVLASHSDPGPLVIAEARNAGCAIVATDVDGIPEMLDRGQAGILVPPKQPEMIARAVGGLLADDAALQKYSGLAKKNSERFTIERVCRDMDKIYAELLPAGG